MKIITRLIFIWSIFLSGTGVALAEGGGFSITPFLKEINLSDNQKEESFFVEMENNSNFIASVDLSVADFGSMNETGGVLLLDHGKEMSSGHSLASWIELEKESFLLEAGEKNSIAVKVINTDSLSPGGHYGVIMANVESFSNKKDDRAASDINLNSKLTSLVFLRKEEGATYGLELARKEKEKSLFSLPNNVRLHFENRGNIHVTARGLVSISDPLGREVRRGIINSESRILLPESTKSFLVDIKKISLSFIPGKYKLAVQHRYDGMDTYNMSEEEFFFFPMASIISLSIIFIGTLGVILRRNLKRKNNPK